MDCRFGFLRGALKRRPEANFKIEVQSGLKDGFLTRRGNRHLARNNFEPRHSDTESRLSQARRALSLLKIKQKIGHIHDIN